MPKASLTSNSVDETLALAAQFARNLKAGDIVFLQGNLGAGKTVFTKGIAQALGVKARQVNSPTFVVMNVYDGAMPIYHFDLYRLEKEEELRTVHFDEYFYGQGISIVEWPERFKANAPTEHWLVELAHMDDNTRSICISYPSNPRRSISV